jgi:putative transcriptional regulator
MWKKIRMTKIKDYYSNYQGQLLLATPKMLDFRFEKSVILICSHTGKGTMGIIVNKPNIELKFGDILKQLKINSRNQIINKEIYFGGPVEYGRGFVVHSTDYDVPNVSINIQEEYRVTASIEILEDIANGHGPKDSLLALGYAGWGPGQLESELLLDSWLMCDADPDLIFSLQSETKWKSGLEKIGVNPSKLATLGGSA